MKHTFPGTTYTVTFTLGPSIGGSDISNHFDVFIFDGAPVTTPPTPVFVKNNIGAKSTEQFTFTVDASNIGSTSILFGGWSKTGSFYVAKPRCDKFLYPSFKMAFITILSAELVKYKRF